MKFYWYKDFLVTEEFKSSDRKNLRKINAGKKIEGMYLVMLSQSDDTLFEIVPSSQMTQSFYNDKTGYVVGAALSKESAELLASRIAATYYADYRDGNIKDFYKGGFMEKPNLFNVRAV
ncbi:MAG: hypothetical protein IJM37_04345 [Lachnospiraceae bacterium]|nr:hypothetical protein [Lachnospiraceae bacterium]